MRITIIANANNQFVNAYAVFENLSANNIWQDEYIVFDNMDGTYSFKNVRRDKFIVADFNSSPPYVRADRLTIGEWEKFRVIDQGDFTFALQACNNNYVCTDMNEWGNYLVANRTVIGEWEKYTLNVVPYQLDIGAESVEDYSGCGCTGNLSYCNDQAALFVNKMANWHHINFLFCNSNAWNKDIVEDELGGNDRNTADNVHVLLISGHGNFDASLHRYYAYLCPSSGYSDCYVGSDKMYLGEHWTQPNHIYPGKLRFLILCTCFGLEAGYEMAEWSDVFKRGKNLQCVMGYSGLSSDASSTANVPEEFAQKAAGDGWTLKTAWFWAIEDFWVDDHAALIVSGKDASNALYRCENLQLNWEPVGDYPWWFCWVTHVG